MALYLKKYNESPVREFYVNIAYFLCCSHYTNVEGTGLEGDMDCDDITKVLSRVNEAN